MVTNNFSKIIHHSIHPGGFASNKIPNNPRIILHAVPMGLEANKKTASQEKGREAHKNSTNSYRTIFSSIPSLVYFSALPNIQPNRQVKNRLS